MIDNAEDLKNKAVENKAGLKREDLYKILPVITLGGAGERIATPIAGDYMYLDYLKQFSVMKFNYDGFYSCSVTIAGIGGESAELKPIYEDFNLTLDHPYVFEVTKNVKVGNSAVTSKVPLVVGEIINPNYSD